MKLRLIDDIWVHLDTLGSRRTNVGESSSSMPSTSSNEILKLLKSLYIKQDNHLGHIQGLKNRVDNPGVKLDNEFLELHQWLNTITS